MKRITEQFGNPCNLMECSWEEFDMLRAMLLAEGMEARITESQWDRCTFEIRNTYREMAMVFGNMKGEAICKKAESAIADGGWRR